MASVTALRMPVAVLRVLSEKKTSGGKIIGSLCLFVCKALMNLDSWVNARE
jgi:hypothetical protein